MFLILLSVDSFYWPGNGSPSPIAMNVVLGVFVVIRCSKYKSFFISKPIVIKLCIQIEHTILRNRTVSDFQAKSNLINNN